MPANEQQVQRVIIGGTLAYIVLLALPFIPGAEIGIAMLTAFGAGVGPLVYGATMLTMLAMLLSCTVGRLLSIPVLARLLLLLRIQPGCGNGDARCAPATSRAVCVVIGRRAAPNTDSGAASPIRRAGTGGEHSRQRRDQRWRRLMLMAGVSGIFAPLPTVLAVAMAVAPMPLVVVFLGLSGAGTARPGVPFRRFMRNAATRTNAHSVRSRTAMKGRLSLKQRKADAQGPCQNHTKRQA